MAERKERQVFGDSAWLTQDSALTVNSCSPPTIYLCSLSKAGADAPASTSVPRRGLESQAEAIFACVKCTRRTQLATRDLYVDRRRGGSAL